MSSIPLVKTKKPVKDPSVMDIIKASQQHKTLYSLIKRAALVRELSNMKNVTILAPTDDAFLNVELPTKKGDIKNLLLLHVLQYTRAPPPNYKTMKSFSTLAKYDDNTPVRISAVPLRRYMKPTKELRGSNGVVFSMNKVL